MNGGMDTEVWLRGTYYLPLLCNFNLKDTYRQLWKTINRLHKIIGGGAGPPHCLANDPDTLIEQSLF